jgi:hypothetical protein
MSNEELSPEDIKQLRYMKKLAEVTKELTPVFESLRLAMEQTATVMRKFSATYEAAVSLELETRREAHAAKQKQARRLSGAQRTALMRTDPAEKVVHGGTRSALMRKGLVHNMEQERHLRGKMTMKGLQIRQLLLDIEARGGFLE